MKRGCVIFCLLLVVVLTAGAGWAQTANDESPAPGSREEALRRISLLRIYKLTEMLELNEEEAAQLFPIILRYDRQFQDITQKKDRLMEELHLELQSEQPDEARLQKMVDDILTLEREAMRLRTEQFKELKKLLTAEQYAKFLIFDHHFREDINRMLDDIRQQRRPRRGRPDMPPSPPPPPQ